MGLLQWPSLILQKQGKVFCNFWETYFAIPGKISLQQTNQNEWRVIIAGEDDYLVPNCGSGFLLKIDPFRCSVVMRTSGLLSGAILLEEGNVRIHTYENLEVLRNPS